LEDSHFDAEDQVISFVTALNVARGELSLAVDLLDLARETATFQAVDSDLDGLTDAGKPQAWLWEVDANPGLVGLEQASHDLPRLEKVPRSDREDLDERANRGGDLTLSELDPNLGGTGLGLGQLSARLADLFRAGPAAHQPF
jgi:hypothetical protein